MKKKLIRSVILLFYAVTILFSVLPVNAYALSCTVNFDFQLQPDLSWTDAEKAAVRSLMAGTASAGFTEVTNLGWVTWTINDVENQLVFINPSPYIINIGVADQTWNSIGTITVSSCKATYAQSTTIVPTTMFYGHDIVHIYFYLATPPKADFNFNGIPDENEYSSPSAPSNPTYNSHNVTFNFQLVASWRWTDSENSAVEQLEVGCVSYGYHLASSLSEVTWTIDDYSKSLTFYNMTSYIFTIHFADSSWNNIGSVIVSAGSVYNESVVSVPSSMFHNYDFVYVYYQAASPPSPDLNLNGIPDSSEGYVPPEDVNYNTGIVNFFAELPSGENVPLGSVQPPENWVGAYSFQYSSVMGTFKYDEFVISALSGYELDTDYFDVAKIIVIPDDEVITIYVPYRVLISGARTLRFELYDENDRLVYYETVKVSSSTTTCNTPLYKSYDTYPLFVNIDMSKPVTEPQIFKCFVIDILSIKNKSYNDGYNSGLSVGELNSLSVQQAWQEGYDVGIAEGLSQNSLTQAQIRKYTSDYNAFTGIFQGIYEFVRDTFFTIGDGISYRGVSLLDILSLLIILAVVIWGYKTVF